MQVRRQLCAKCCHHCVRTQVGGDSECERESSTPPALAAAAQHHGRLAACQKQCRRDDQRMSRPRKFEISDADLIPRWLLVMSIEALIRFAEIKIVVSRLPFACQPAVNFPHAPAYPALTQLLRTRKRLLPHPASDRAFRQGRQRYHLIKPVETRWMTKSRFS